MLISRTNGGWIRKANPGRVSMSKKVSMMSNLPTAVNGKGWEVQKLTQQGWMTISPIVSSRGLAETLKDNYANHPGEYRVYEAL